MQIAAYKGKSATSRLIRWLTRSDYSHVAFLLDRASEDAAWRLNHSRDLKLPWFHAGAVVEAWTQGGVRCVQSLSSLHTPGTPVDVFDFHRALTSDEEQGLLRFLWGELGKRFDWKHVFKFVTRREGKEDERWFCSELVFAAAQRANRTLFERTEAWQVPPDWVPRSPLLRFDHELRTG